MSSLKNTLKSSLIKTFILAVIFSQVTVVNSNEMNHGFLKETTNGDIIAPTVEELVRCIRDIDPLLKDLLLLIKSFNTPEKEKVMISAFAVNLLADGYKLKKDCEKVVPYILHKHKLFA